MEFKVNRTEIDPLYRNNPEELGKITATIDSVSAIPGAFITSITIHGYASPEGRYDDNARLAAGRSAALVDFVRGRYGLPDSLFRAESTPEDWEGLRNAVRRLDFPGKEGILGLMAREMHPDAREAEIRRRWPESYAFLLKNVYPALRHSDYTVKYNVKGYTERTETHILTPTPAPPESQGTEAVSVEYIPCPASVASFLGK